MQRGLLMSWRIILASTAFLVATAKTLVDIGIVNSKPGYGSIVIIGGALVVLADSVGRIVLTNRRGKAAALRADLEKSVQTTLKTISEVTGLDVWSLGGSVFVPRKRRLREQTLERIARVRLSDSPQATVVKWVPGKGVVGQVWKERRNNHKNWKAIAERYPADSITEESFETIPDSARCGFTFEEFRAIVDKYAEIRGVLIWDESQKNIIGVLSIDVAMTDSHASLGLCLDSRESKETAERGAALLSNVLGKR